MPIPRIDAADIAGLDDAGLIALAVADFAAEQAGMEPTDELAALTEQYERVTLAVHEGDQSLLPELERLEADIGRLELERRRAAAARRAEVARVARVEAERVARERAEAEAAQAEARAELEALEPTLRASAEAFAGVAGQVMTLGLQASNGPRANLATHVAEALRTALLGMAEPGRRWLLGELGRPAARNRPVE